MKKKGFIFILTLVILTGESQKIIKITRRPFEKFMTTGSVCEAKLPFLA